MLPRTVVKMLAINSARRKQINREIKALLRVRILCHVKLNMIPSHMTTSESKNNTTNVMFKTINR